MISFDEYARHDGLALAGLVRRGEVSAAELPEPPSPASKRRTRR